MTQKADRVEQYKTMLTHLIEVKADKTAKAMQIEKMPHWVCRLLLFSKDEKLSELRSHINQLEKDIQETRLQYLKLKVSYVTNQHPSKL